MEDSDTEDVVKMALNSTESTETARGLFNQAMPWTMYTLLDTWNTNSTKHLSIALCRVISRVSWLLNLRTLTSSDVCVSASISSTVPGQPGIIVGFSFIARRKV